MSRSFRTILRRAGLIVAALACAWLASTGVVTWRLLGRARPPFDEPLPAELAGRAEPVRLTTRDGEELGAWWSGGADSALALLLLHGNEGSRSETSGLVRRLVDREIAALAISLRAHGDSSGDLNDFGWSARADVLAGVELIERRAPHARIVIVGRSLGAAAAVYAARELGTRVSAYALEAPYRDLRSAARARLRRALPVPAAEVALAGMSLWARLWLPAEIDALSPLDRIGDVPREAPILLLTGTSDDRAPAADVEEIARRVPGQAEIVRFDGAGHVNLHGHDPARFEAALLRVCAGLARPVSGR